MRVVYVARTLGEPVVAGEPVAKPFDAKIARPDPDVTDHPGSIDQLSAGSRAGPEKSATNGAQCKEALAEPRRKTRQSLLIELHISISFKAAHLLASPWQTEFSG